MKLVLREHGRINWRKAFVFAALGILSLATAAVLLKGPDTEPVYRGKRLHEYLDHFSVVGESTDEDLEAFIAFGTNATPYVRAAFRVRDTPIRRMTAWVALKAPWLKLRVRPVVEIHEAALDAYRGILEAIGEGRGDPSAADDCAPEIRRLLKDADPSVRMRAAEVFHLIGYVKKNHDPQAVRTRDKRNSVNGEGTTTSILPQ